MEGWIKLTVQSCGEQLDYAGILSSSFISCPCLCKYQAQQNASLLVATVSLSNIEVPCGHGRAVGRKCFPVWVSESITSHKFVCMWVHLLGMYLCASLPMYVCQSSVWWTTKQDLHWITICRPQELLNWTLMDHCSNATLFGLSARSAEVHLVAPSHEHWVETQDYGNMIATIFEQTFVQNDTCKHGS